MAGKNFDISKFAATLKPVSESDTMMEIPVDDIRDNPRNFYPTPDPQALRALADSIRANGLLEPPTVVPAGDGTYRLISGHSRLAAIRSMWEDGTEEDLARFSKILCRVLPPMSEGQEQAAVIEANRQRVKSNALLADEAEKLTAAYIKRREAGEELPGRIRDRVAEALKINATKVANLSAIKNGLKVPGLVERWKRDEIPEAAALQIARMDIDEQYRLLDWIIDKRRSCTINEVRKFSTCYTVTRRKCEHTGRMCENAERMYDHDYRYGEWHGSNCCLHCLDRDTCPAACQYVEKKPVEQPEKPPLNPAVKDPRLDYKVMVPTFCQRVRALREQTGMSKKEFAESINEYPNTYSAYENNSICGADKVPKLALCLGTTTDYLYGLTDELTPPTLPEGQLMISGWMPGSTTPAEPGEFATYVDLGDGKLLKRFFDWDGQHWMMPGGIEAQAPVAWWMRLPPVPAAGKGDGND
jgi:ParB-like chromosome segregation protein Spo0J/DNA-binding XRE family transcriptional regulator